MLPIGWLTRRTCCVTNLWNTFRIVLMQYVRRQPTATLLDVWSEAIRWEWEGLPGVVGVGVSLSHLHLVSSTGSKGLGGQPPPSEVRTGRHKGNVETTAGPVKSTHSVPFILAVSSTAPTSILSRPGRMPGHYTSECDGVLVPSRAQSSSVHQSSNRQSRPAQQSEN